MLLGTTNMCLEVITTVFVCVPRDVLCVPILVRGIEKHVQLRKTIALGMTTTNTYHTQRQVSTDLGHKTVLG